MRTLVSILLFFLTVTINGQMPYDSIKVSKKTQQIVVKIQKVNELMGRAVYEAGIKPKQYDNFEQLKATARKEELIELTNHPNGVVRCYSFWALSHDNSINLLPIIINHISDDELINTQFGCLGGREKVGDFFINIVTPQYVDLNSKKLTETELRQLDSILIFGHNNLYAKSHAINRAKVTEPLYDKMRELVINNHDQSALVALAKYQKPQDVELIRQNKTAGRNEDDDYFFTYKAICEFPHSSFLPFLESNLKKTLEDTHFSNEWRELYKAIASYKNEKAIELLKIPFTQIKHDNIRKYHIDFVFAALRNYKDSIYDNLFWTLWTEEKRITPDVFDYLYKRNPGNAYELTKKSLLNTDEFYGANISFDFEDLNSSENLTVKMLDLVLQKDNQLGFEVIRSNLKEANVHQFPIFAQKVSEIQDKSFIGPLFDRLSKESNAHVYLKIAETLLSYKDPAINKRILEVRKKNTDLTKDWGSKALDKLLKEHNIN
jgi:hypothetical protein